MVGIVLISTASSLPTRAEATAGQDWNQWRGAGRDAQMQGESWPTQLDGLTRAWRVELGRGYPGPIVAGQRVFVVETVDAKTAAARALDRSSGEVLWTHSWPSKGSVPFFATSNGDWVRSTPAFDGKTLFVGDMSEVLIAIDGSNGKERWRVDFPARYETGIPDFGFATSPLLDGDALFVQAANSIVKLEAATGKTLWRALEGSGRIQASGAFSSPVLAELNGRRQLIVLTRLTLFGLDPGTGEVLWSHDVPNFRGMNILTPVVHGNSIFTSPYKNQSYRFDVVERDGALAVEQAWANKASGYMSSPVVVGDHVYLHLGNGRLDCIDLRTGESRWRSEALGKYWSMVVQGDKILALDDGGQLYLIKANPDRFELLAKKQVADASTWAHLAVSGEDILVRELEAVSLYRWSNE